jgi:hypothetical protein
MQCTPVNIINGGGDESYLDTLPSIFIANEDGSASTCITGDGGVLGIVNPGSNVVTSKHEDDKVVDAVLAPCNDIYGDPSTAPNSPARAASSGTGVLNTTAPAQSEGPSISFPPLGPQYGSGSASVPGISASATHAIDKPSSYRARKTGSLGYPGGGSYNRGL